MIQKLLNYFDFVNENKAYTLREIENQEEDLRLVQELLLFKKIVIVDSKIKGILLEKGYSFNLHELQSESFNELIPILQNVGRLLEELRYIREKEKKLETFFIGDLQEENILVDKETKKIQICDLDSCKIGDNKPFRAKYSFCRTFYHVFQNLEKKYPLSPITSFIPNHNFELYCYIATIMNVLFHIEIQFMDVPNYFKWLHFMKEQGFPEPLFEIFLNIYSPKDNVNPYPYLDAIPNRLERNLKL